jgi:ankyrin repeat protein
LEKVKALLKDNPDLVFSKDNKYGGTPLHLAAATGHKDVAKLLLANKADVNAKDNRDATPLHLATSAGYKDVAELLRQHGGQE